MRSAADPPDVIVFDCMMTAACAAIRQLDVRSVALVHVLYQPFVHEWGNDVLQTDVLSMLDGADLVLATTPSDFDRHRSRRTLTTLQRSRHRYQPTCPRWIGSIFGSSASRATRGCW